MFDVLKTLDLNALPADVRAVLLGVGQRNVELEKSNAALSNALVLKSGDLLAPKPIFQAFRERAEHSISASTEDAKNRYRAAIVHGHELNGRLIEAKANSAMAAHILDNIEDEFERMDAVRRPAQG